QTSLLFAECGRAMHDTLYPRVQRRLRFQRSYRRSTRRDVCEPNIYRLTVEPLQGWTVRIMNGELSRYSPVEESQEWMWRIPIAGLFSYVPPCVKVVNGAVTGADGERSLNSLRNKLLGKPHRVFHSFSFRQ